jgi:hypothetical protein
MSERLTETEAAAYIDMSVSFLQADRCHGPTGNRTPGPPYLKLGKGRNGKVRYLRSDLDRWLAERRVDRAERSQRIGRRDRRQGEAA